MSKSRNGSVTVKLLNTFQIQVKWGETYHTKSMVDKLEADLDLKSVAMERADQALLASFFSLRYFHFYFTGPWL